MAVRFNLPIIAFDDANGNPLSGGFVEFYNSGLATAKDIFEDDDLTIPAANIDPNTPGSHGYTLDSAGRHGDIFLEPGDYKVVVKNSLGTIIKTMDPVHGSAAAGVEFEITVERVGSVAITTGIKADEYIDWDFEIYGWVIQCDQSTNQVWDIWAKAFAQDSPPTVTNTITASAKPTLTANQQKKSATLTGWTKTFTAGTAGTALRFNLDSNSAAVRTKLTLLCRRT